MAGPGRGLILGVKAHSIIFDTYPGGSDDDSIALMICAMFEG